MSKIPFGRMAAVVFAGLALPSGLGFAPGVNAADPAELRARAKAEFGVVPDQMPGAEHDTPELIALGRKLFSDPRLSVNDRQSCASCHVLDGKGAGVDHLLTARGAKGQRTARNTPTVLNAGFQFAQFWDAHATSLVAQAREPMLNPAEMGMPDEASVERKLAALPEYRTAFEKAFAGTNRTVSFAGVTRALAAFERTLVTHDRFDDFLKGDEAALTEPELKGLETFFSTGCTFCHKGPLLGGTTTKVLGEEIPWPADDEADAGAAGVPRNDEFKVPMLRNVALTAPYFHNGKIATLEEAIRKMSYHQVGRELPDDEVEAIAAFLRTLTDKARRDVPTEANPK